MGNVALTIRSTLINAASITDEVDAENIFISNSPVDSADKQIVIKEILGSSNSVLDAEQGQITLMVIIDNTVAEPYSVTRDIAEKILTLLNKQNESLIDANSNIRWFVKSGIDYDYNVDEDYWMGVINFSYVEGGIT